MFLRFGYLLGQGGVFGVLGLLLVRYSCSPIREVGDRYLTFLKLHHQSYHHVVYLRDIVKRNCERRWSLLPNISITWSGVWRKHWSCVLPRFCLQHRYERRRSGRLPPEQFRAAVWNPGQHFPPVFRKAHYPLHLYFSNFGFSGFPTYTRPLCSCFVR